jgi:predicted nucleotidyltransferase
MERTVTALPTIELDAYRKAIKASRRLGKGGTEARFQQAWEVAKRGASILKKDFGAKKVILFGSATQPHLFHLRSDVDLAVWGLAERDYFRAVGILQSLEPTIEVDLILAEEASPRLTESIQQGKEI